MADTTLPEEGMVPENLWTLIKQLRICDLAIAIKQIVLDAFKHLTNVTKGRSSNLETSTLLCKEFVKTRTGYAVLTAVAVVVYTILSIYFMSLALPFLDGLNFVSTEPAAGKLLGL
jgi:hypothetical protein